MAPKDYIAARTAKNDDSRHYYTMVDDRPYYPVLKVDWNNHASIREVAARIMMVDQWVNKGTSDEEIVAWPVSVVAGGITNQLFRVEMTTSATAVTTKTVNGQDQTTTASSSSTAITTTKKNVLVRIFGAEGMIDRDIENATFAALAQQGLSPAYYGRFANGRVEEWLDGMRPLSTRELTNPQISHSIARQLSRVHTLFQLPEALNDYHNIQEPSLWTQLNAWMNQAATATFQNDNDTERASQLQLQKIPAELTWLQQDVVPKDAAVAFCHNDILAANVLYNPQATPTGADGGGTTTHTHTHIRLIDFEYGGMNYLAFDIANHFNEFAGGTDDGVTNYDWFPTRDQQLAFVKSYLESAVDVNHSSSSSSRVTTITGEEIDTLYDQVQAFLLANHLYWGLWAVNQAATEGCQDFDYLLFARNRLARYFEIKES